MLTKLYSRFYAWLYKQPGVTKVLIALATLATWFGFATLVLFVSVVLVRDVLPFSLIVRTLLASFAFVIIGLYLPVRFLLKLSDLSDELRSHERASTEKDHLIMPDASTEAALADLGHGADAYERLLTGQLVAHLRRDKDLAYRNEYLRRLCYLGFSVDEATGVLSREYDALIATQRVELLPSDALSKPLFTDDRCPFVLKRERYVLDGMETCSHLVKIFDEAERLYAQGRGPQMEDHVWEQIVSIVEPEGYYHKVLDLFLTELAIAAEVPMEKVRRYAHAERQLLARCRWSEDVDHPYLACEV